MNFIMKRALISIFFIFSLISLKCQTTYEEIIPLVQKAELKKGPYLQIGNSNSIIIRWSSDVPTDSRVSYGTDQNNLNFTTINSLTTTDHEVQLIDLIPDTRYFYSISAGNFLLQGDSSNYFTTSPIVGTEKKVRIWATGDCGSHFVNQFEVRDAYKNYIDTNITDIWMLLGDNAYLAGSNDEYQANFFNVYNEKMLKQTVLWPAPGNHEYANSAILQNSHNIPYYSLFTIPTQGEAGGVASGTEAYYSYDYANIHLISLDSYGNEENLYRLYDTLGPQVTWLKQDLETNSQKWTIVYFHHPPYTMGTHNSDTEGELVHIRQNLVKILERYKVDLVLCGHSHVYERSKLMKGHLGNESSFDSSIHNLSSSSGKYDGSDQSCPYVKNETTFYNGTVYVVSGSAGKVGGTLANSWPHDAMYFSDAIHGGSMAIEIEANRLNAKWICGDGVIRDEFTIVKDVNQTKYLVINKGETVTLKSSWIGVYNWNTGASQREITVTPLTDTTYFVTDGESCLSDVFKVRIVDQVSFNVYPNPGSGIINIEFKSPMIENISLEVYDLSGRLIKRLKSDFQNYGFYSYTLDTSAERLSGMYIFKLRYGENTMCKKVVIN